MRLNSLATLFARYSQVTGLALGLLLIPAYGFTESMTEPPQPWYQIEIMVFANQRSPADDEHWPVVERSYPPELVCIGPETGAALSPLNLGQLKQIAAYEQLLSSAAPEQTVAEPDNEFLFQSMSRKSATYDTALTEDDLLAGITREPTPNEITPDIPADHIASNVESDMNFVPAPNSGLKPGDIGILFENSNTREAFRNLSADELTLSALSKRIEQSPQYKLLYHAGWRQQIPPMEDTMPILLQGGDQYDDLFELDGYVTISKSRYLHLDTNLWYTQYVPRSGQSSIVLPDHTQYYSQEDRDLLRQYPQVQHYEAMRDNYLPTLTYSMRQSRKLKVAALHYLDHPAFGLLIKIEEYNPAPLTGAR